MFRFRSTISSPRYWRHQAQRIQGSIEDHRRELARLYPGEIVKPYMSGAADLVEAHARACAHAERIEQRGSFHDRAWIEAKCAEARDLWLANTDPVLETGRRRVYRKWNENRVMIAVSERINESEQGGHPSKAERLRREFMDWYFREDRKEFDRTGDSRFLDATFISLGQLDG